MVSYEFSFEELLAFFRRIAPQLTAEQRWQIVLELARTGGGEPPGDTEPPRPDSTPDRNPQAGGRSPARPAESDRSTRDGSERAPGKGAEPSSKASSTAGRASRMEVVLTHRAQEPDAPAVAPPEGPATVEPRVSNRSPRPVPPAPVPTFDGAAGADRFALSAEDEPEAGSDDDGPRGRSPRREAAAPPEPPAPTRPAPGVEQVRPIRRGVSFGSRDETAPPPADEEPPAPLQRQDAVRPLRPRREQPPQEPPPAEPEEPGPPRRHDRQRQGKPAEAAPPVSGFGTFDQPPADPAPAPEERPSPFAATPFGGPAASPFSGGPLSGSPFGGAPGGPPALSPFGAEPPAAGAVSDPFAHAAPLPGQKTAAPFGSTSPLGGSPFSPASPLASSPFGAGPGNGPAGPTPFGSTSPFGGSFPGPGAPAFGPSPFDAAGQDPGEDQGAAPGTAGRGSPFGAGTPPSPFDQFQAPERDDGMIGAEEGPPPSPLRAMGGAGPVRSAPVAVSEAPPAGSGSAWTASLHDLFKPIRAQARDLDPQEIGRLVASSVREVRQKK